MVAYVVIPGIDGSDEQHWQSLWETHWETPTVGASAIHTSAVRIAPASWSAPDLSDWVSSVQSAYETAARRDSRVVLVAHSLGCWAAAQWLERVRPEKVAAFLVAPPDPAAAAFPRAAAATFLDLTARPLPCPGTVVASGDDPYCDPATAASFARAWGVRYHLVGDHGHLNSGSGLGAWQEGAELLHALVESSGP
ncbi:RBBP9/YdeN family alpha/beta hydrolase [Streptomyces sp. NPDC005863]|uniref:RBBP9/YdeN family alpha/beta hydrolase n=1 Tax=unclassified Streptomyces TaxID=2593676 RepID=UPI0033DBF56E